MPDGTDDGVHGQSNTYTYDGVGNITRDLGSGLANYTATSTYDAANQQTQLFDGITLHTFTYDGTGPQPIR